MVGKSKQQEPEAAGDATSTVRRRAMNAWLLLSPLSFTQARSPARGLVPPTGLPTLVKATQISLPLWDAVEIHPS